MKITVTQLRKIISEETQRNLREMRGEGLPFDPMRMVDKIAAQAAAGQLAQLEASLDQLQSPDFDTVLDAAADPADAYDVRDNLVTSINYLIAAKTPMQVKAAKNRVSAGVMHLSMALEP